MKKLKELFLDFNTDPASIFWSIILIVLFHLGLFHLYDISNNNIDVIIGAYLVYSIISFWVMLILLAAPNYNNPKLLPFWILGSIINIIFVIIIPLLIILIGVVKVVKLNIDTYIRNFFKKSESNQYIKPLWKKIISKIIGI